MTIQIVCGILLGLTLAELALAAVLRVRIWRGADPIWRVCCPRGYLAILLALMALLLAIILLLVPDRGRDGDKLLVLTSTGEAVSGFLMVGLSRTGILYDENGFTHRGLISPARRFSYGDITGIRGWNTTEIWCGRRKITLETGFKEANSDMKFLSYARARYRQERGCAIPPVKRKDVFCGNVDAPDTLFGALTFVILLMAAITVWQAAEAQKPYQAAELEPRTVTFFAYDEANNAVWLYSKEDPLKFKLDGIDQTVSNRDLLKQRCDGATHFLAALDDTEATTRGGYYIIADLRDDTGIIYTTLELASAQKWKRERISIYLYGALAIMVAALLTAMVAVGRHPERYSGKFARSLFVRRYDEQRVLPNILTPAERKKLQSQIVSDPRLREKQIIVEMPVEEFHVSGVCLRTGRRILAGVEFQGKQLIADDCGYADCADRDRCEIGRRIAERLEGSGEG